VRARARERKSERVRVKASKRETLIKDIYTGEVLAVCDLSEARAKAIVRAYLLAGLEVEAVA
jgi:hypothetical protein